MRLIKRIILQLGGLLLLVGSLSGCLLQQTQRPAPEQEVVATAPQTEPLPAEPVSHWGLPDRDAAQCESPYDLWERIRRGFTLPDGHHQRVDSDLKWFAEHQGYLDRVADRASPYLHLIVDAVEERGMPSEIALLPVVESAFQPFAYSHGRAAGLWQFVPGTGRRFGLKQTWWYDGRRDVASATQAALDYLQYLHKHFDGDWLLALAAYNSGEGTVQRAVRQNRRRGKPTDFWSLDLPRETRGYVPKLLAISRLVANPPAHGVLLSSIPDQPYLTSVDIGSQIDLDLAAELAGLPLEELYLYNPGFNRWATDPAGPHQLLVPLDNAALFRLRLAAYPEEKRITWTRYRIREGDNLNLIAKRHRTTTDLIKKVNNMRGNTIIAGRSLVIPVARKDLKRYSLSAEQRLRATQTRARSGYKLDYTVRAGDTLWEIARRYNVGVRQLAKWNAMAPRDPLRPGQKLVIWTQDEELVSTINPADFVHPFQQNTLRRIGYTVRRGDSLARISARFRVSVQSLMRWNRIDGNSYLQPGQRLTLYVDVTSQSGRI